MVYYPSPMRNIFNWLPKAVLVAALSIPVFALSPIATVSSADPFLLDGRAVSGSGITSVPLGVGSEVATAMTPVVLFFSDGSSVKLAASSRVKLTGSTEQPKLVLLSGALDYKVVLGSNLSVTSLDLERKMTPAVRQVQPAHKTVPAPRAEDATLSVVTH